MTEVLIDRATLELVLRTLNRLRYDNDSAMAEEGFHEAAEALRAALANAEPTKFSLTNTSTGTLPQRVESIFEAMDKEVAAGRLVRTAPMEWSKPK